MPVKLFLLGRPGSGKSTASQAITNYLRQKREDWSVVGIQEYSILYKMFLSDYEGKKFYPNNYGAFNVLDFSVFDEASKKIEKIIQQNMSSAKSRELLTIEFARSDYNNAFKQFDVNLLRDSYFLIVEANVETCIQRIQERIPHSIKADDHFVSDEILRSYYQKDNIHYMISNFKTDYSISKEVEVIHNEGSMGDFVEQVNQFIDVIFQLEDDVSFTTSTFASKENPLIDYYEPIDLKPSPAVPKPPSTSLPKPQSDYWKDNVEPPDQLGDNQLFDKKESEISLFAIASASLEDDDRALVGRFYSVQAGLSRSKPDNFEGEPFDLPLHSIDEPLLFDILLHANENIKLTTEWYKPLEYDSRNPEPQLIEFTFQVISSGSCTLNIDFYHERRWLTATQIEFVAFEKTQLTTVSLEV